ncbi:MAG: hypothetical protein BZY82_11860 [SAR202 cluster bacterium Io17-Chloro-G3]|nr:MAG: hypothetical protein BZY82_11860 [SAR202 cluster bacterium Io17-Chloro-G3]
MKLVLYDDFNPGILKGDTVVDIASVVAHLEGGHGQHLMEGIIDSFGSLQPELEKVAKTARALPLSEVRLRPPLPRPSKILCCIGNYWEHMERDPRPLNMFLKSPESIIGPGDTVELPEFQAEVFHHEAELGVVMKGPARNISELDYMKAVFGYTCFTDVSARDDGRKTWRAGSFLGKSFDTFCPIGPCIVTVDEIRNPNALGVKYWVNGQLRHDYITDDMEHRVPELVSFATAVMTMNTGDLIACGTNHEGLGPLQDGDIGEIEIQGIGRMSINVSDPLKRSWERGIYMGIDSTAHGAQREH